MTLDRDFATLKRNQERARTLEIGPAPLAGNYLALPGLVAFWPMSSVQLSTGNAYDLSGQGRTLTYTGNPTYNQYNAVPYFDADGTGDWLTRADEADLDILGSSAFYASAVRGLTMGGWFWMDSLTTTRALIGKGDGATNAGSSYTILVTSSTPIMTAYSGATNKSATGAVLTTGAWYFIVGKFEPSTRVSITQNVSGILTKSSNTTSIPATLNNTAAPFQLMAVNSIAPTDGRASMCFLCANALSDAHIAHLYNATRVWYGV